MVIYHNDHLGTPQKLTAVNGAVVWSAKYSSFGEALVDSSSSVINKLRFSGQYYDQETGLHYNYHRYYDSKLGRYLRTDPLNISVRVIGAKGNADSFSGLGNQDFENLLVYSILIRSGVLHTPQKQNLFSYAQNDPINRIDPKGLTAIVVPTPAGPVVVPMPPPPIPTTPLVGTPSFPPIKPPNLGGFDIGLCKAICDGKFKCEPIKRKVCHHLCYVTALAAFFSGL